MKTVHIRPTEFYFYLYKKKKKQYTFDGIFMQTEAEQKLCIQYDAIIDSLECLTWQLNA